MIASVRLMTTNAAALAGDGSERRTQAVWDEDVAPSAFVSDGVSPRVAHRIRVR